MVVVDGGEDGDTHDCPRSFGFLSASFRICLSYDLT